MKECSRCKEEKAGDQFGKRASRKSGKQSHCRECENKRNAQPDRKEQQWESHLRIKFNITPDDYLNLLIAQGAVCKICSRPEAVKFKVEFKQLAVDHIEVDGKIIVRGLLCHFCNTALGKFKDDKNLLQNAINYIGSEKFIDGAVV